MGNFGWVIEDVYEHAYEPMLGALERHPTVRAGAALHGPAARVDGTPSSPSSIDRLRALVERDQVEILGGGLYEPILVSLPERDRVGPARAHARRGRSACSARRRAARGSPSASGSRRCRPTSPTAGYEYTVLDDNHLRGAFVPEDAMWGTYTTDDQGKLLTIFGTEQGLRYRIPWQPVDELIDYLRDATRPTTASASGSMGDDGEKFGAWPGTHELCWGKEEWVDALLRGARGERVVADHGHAVDVDGCTRADRPHLRPDRRHTSR